MSNAAGPDGARPQSDRDSLETALASYRAFLLFVAFRLKESGHPISDSPSDLVQKVMLAAVEKIRDGRIPGGDPREQMAWLRQILINTYHNSARSSKPLQPLPPEIGVDTTSVAARLVKEEEIRAIDEAWDKLGAEERELVDLRYRQGLSAAEIGKLKNYSSSYASRETRDALDALRRLAREDDWSEHP